MPVNTTHICKAVIKANIKTIITCSFFLGFSNLFWHINSDLTKNDEIKGKIKYIAINTKEMNCLKPVDTEKNTYLHLYLSLLRKSNPLTPPSGNRGHLKFFLKNTPKKPSNLNSNSISNPNLDLNFKYPATFQVNKKVNKKVHINDQWYLKIPRGWNVT